MRTEIYKDVAQQSPDMKALVLDLDDTIFQTKSMDARVFEPFFQHFRSLLSVSFRRPMIDAIIADLWEATRDKVIEKYGIPEAMMQDAISFLDNLELNLDISPYPDYHCLRNLPCQKFLVTTSVASIQRKKIRALGIEADFTAIIINDPFGKRQSKLDIFRELCAGYNLVPGSTYVLGDNPESEIEGGNALGMITVQILRPGVIKGHNAQYWISSFEELLPIFHANAYESTARTT